MHVSSVCWIVHGLERFFMQIILTLQLKIAAKVQATHLLIFSQLFSRSMLKYFAINEQIRPVANGERFVYVMVSDQNTDILIFQSGNHRLNVFNGNGVYPRKRFIQ